MGHFLNKLTERAPEINQNRAMADIKKWRANNGEHPSFELVGVSAKKSKVFRYNQGAEHTYFVLDRRRAYFCTVYTQEFVRAMKKAAKRRKRFWLGKP